ncbi:hypothetical protein SLS60_003580 [Paraconiothyrium brasiliense]|uniref:Cytochrome P450 n=1 Tax=Paraconiothyrium brasiliense TaxID=300254 RepID=A0ABR3RPW0_9PLEO
MAPFYKRFAENVTQQVNLLHDRAEGECIHRDDLMQMVGDAVTVSTLDALCGPHLLRLNPDFLHDFWVFDRNLQTYLQGIPWLLAPMAYMARKRVLKAVQIWQQHARDNFDDSAIGPDGDDPFWGTSFFRERHDMFLEMDGFDHEAIASEDFGAIWASRNSITAAFWAIFEVYRDPKLLASVRSELEPCIQKDDNGHIHFDINHLLRLPILQAVYAETLRLRMHFYIVRMPDRVDINIRDWIIPRRKVIVALTTVAHMDATAWDTGANNEHRVDQFWAGRFLRYPAGQRTDRSGVEKQTSDATSPTAPTFSTKHVDGAWIPYGGGPRQCPGRHFAKRQILLTTALFVTLFDCDMLGGAENMGEDFSLKGFGGGVSHPVGKVPVRMYARGVSG